MLSIYLHLRLNASETDTRSLNSFNLWQPLEIYREVELNRIGGLEATTNWFFLGIKSPQTSRENSSVVFLSNPPSQASIWSFSEVLSFL